MAVRRERHPGGEIDAHLDDLAARNAQIMPLQIRALDSRLLRLRHGRRQTAPDEQHRYCYGHHSSGFHLGLL
jgi:hypothetical protein